MLRGKKTCWVKKNRFFYSSFLLPSPSLPIFARTNADRCSVALRCEVASRGVVCWIIRFIPGKTGVSPKHLTPSAQTKSPPPQTHTKKNQHSKRQVTVTSCRGKLPSSLRLQRHWLSENEKVVVLFGLPAQEQTCYCRAYIPRAAHPLPSADDQDAHQPPPEGDILAPRVSGFTADVATRLLDILAVKMGAPRTEEGRKRNTSRPTKRLQKGRMKHEREVQQIMHI